MTTGCKRIRRCAAALAAAALTLFVLLPASGLAQTRELTEQELRDAQHFAIGNTVWVRYHEFGHLLVDEFQIPVLGREEDAVDHLATLIMLEPRSAELNDFLVAAVDAFFLLSERSPAGAQSKIRYEHGLDEGRAYQLACLMYGSSAETFGRFADAIGLLPVSGWDGLFSPSIVMPALVMGLPGVAGVVRLTRASAIDVLGQDYVRTARAKGLTEATVQARHVLRNALTPLITVLGLSLATLVEGAFITATIFGIPGIGKLAVESIFSRDYPVIMAVTLIGSGAFVLANLLADVTYAIIDPRIRYQ